MCFGGAIMHRIVKSHLDNFVKNFGLEADTEAVQFEKFSTYSVIASRYVANFDLDDVVTGDGDGGIDGIAITVNETVVNSLEEVADIFKEPRKNNDVEITFVQAKRTEGFDLGDFLKFKEGVLNFVTNEDLNYSDDVLQNTKEIFEKIIEEVPKIKNGKPSIFVRYVATGIYEKPIELERAANQFKEQIDKTGLFHDFDIKFIDRDELIKMWVSTYSDISASLSAFSIAPLPNISGIDEAYLAVVKAKDFVDKLLLTEDGNLRTQVFDENVRAFLGSDNQVNKSISETISSSSATRFPVLNNGITIVCPELKLQGTTFHLSNYQIVNGCQTSNVLFENKPRLENIMVNIKIVKTKSEDVFSELVRATNSQTRVDDNQFLSIKPIMKKVEQYFNTFEDPESRIYLERRDRQYVGQNIPATRVFSLHTASRCVAAMFCRRPELALRYPKQMYHELESQIFSENNKEITFYAACLTMYRFNLLVSNSAIPQNMKKLRWHFLPVIYQIICSEKAPNLSSRKAEQHSNMIIETMKHHGEKATKTFEKVVEISKSIGEISSDRLKRQLILTEMLDKI
jgi:hypothetical protein